VTAADVAVAARLLVEKHQPHDKPEGVVLVSRRTAIARIQRALARHGERLHLPRGKRQWRELGECFIRDRATGALRAWHCSVVGLTEELGLLRAHERLRIAP
jgi:hypothetical protein